MGWTFDYLEEEVRRQVEDLLRSAGIDEIVEEVECPIDVDFDDTPKTGAYVGKIELEDGSKHKFIFVVYRIPDAVNYNPDIEDDEDEYLAAVHKIVLNNGKVINGNAMSEIEKNADSEKDFFKLKQTIKKVEKDLGIEVSNQSKSKRRMRI